MCSHKKKTKTSTVLRYETVEIIFMHRQLHLYPKNVSKKFQISRYYNKVRYPHEITSRRPTWPLAVNLRNTMYVHNHMLISNLDSTNVI